MLNPSMIIVRIRTLYTQSRLWYTVGDDAAPTFLKEGRGEVEVIVVVVVFHLDLSFKGIFFVIV